MHENGTIVEHTAPNEADASADRQAAALKMLHCLEMLEEEAENFRLPLTSLALRKAIRACKADSMRRFTPRVRRRKVN